ncbi:MAG: OmpA family protein [Bacteroidia bacterium]|nr:OmpA family protein [Bacteroidia bacterium]
MKHVVGLWILGLATVAWAQEPAVWVDETFEDNRRGWPTQSDADFTREIRNGVFLLESKNTPGVALANFYLDDAKAYAIETEFKFLSADAQGKFAVTWGGKGVSAFYAVEIQAQGKVRLYRQVGSDTRVLAEKAGEPVKKGVYTLKVWYKASAASSDKAGVKEPVFEVSLNDKELFETPADKIFGYFHGFFLTPKISVEIERFTVKQNNKIRTVSTKISHSEKENLGPNVNTPYDDIAPVVSADGKTLYYSVQFSPENTGGPGDPDEIYFAELSYDGPPGKRQNIGRPLNNAAPNSVVSVSPDNNTLILLHQYDERGEYRAPGLSYSTRVRSGWTTPKSIVIKDYYNLHRYNNFSLSPDRNTLVMALQREDSKGEQDLYVSFLMPDGEWSVPKNLGVDVNTRGDETTPFIAADGVSLYFASDGRPGYGSKDIFVTRRLDSTWTQWSEPQNLGPLINTPNWDAYFTLPASGRYAYLVSNQNTLGKGDIFRIELPEEIRPRPVLLLKATVTASDGKTPIGAQIEYSEAGSNKIAGSASANPKDGSFTLVLPAGKEYLVSLSAENGVKTAKKVSTQDVHVYTERTERFSLDVPAPKTEAEPPPPKSPPPPTPAPVEKAKPERISGYIRFPFNQDAPVPGWEPELIRVAELIKSKPDKRIVVAGHTDSTGTDAYNMNLSLRRAEWVKNFLIQHGVEAGRIKVENRGEREPLLPNSTLYGRKRNRRVEIYWY